MAFEKFKPTIWSKFMQHQLGKMTVFEKDCNFQFKGEVGKGKKVKILGITRPTIGDYTGDSIDEPNELDGNEVELVIDQAKYFNFGIDDIDEAQAIEGVMQAYLTEATRAMAEERDTYIAAMAKDFENASASTAITDANSAKSALNAALNVLHSKGVKLADNVTAYLSPQMYMHLYDHITSLKNNNDAMIEDGVLGMYCGAKIKMTNNAFNDGTDDYIIIKTDRAIAFASGINSVEAYRPEGRFMDAIKGLNTYGGKIVHPDEMYVIKAHYTA